MLAPHLSAIALLSFWIGSIAILSVQNATPVSLKFLVFQSIQIPVGVIFAFSVCLGLFAGVLALPSLTKSPSSNWSIREKDLSDR